MHATHIYLVCHSCTHMHRGGPRETLPASFFLSILPPLLFLNSQTLQLIPKRAGNPVRLGGAPLDLVDLGAG